MGLFSKKSTSSTKPIAREDLIPCDKVLTSPPDSYGKAQPLPQLTKEEWHKYKQVLQHFQQDEVLLPVKSSSGSSHAGAETKDLSSWEKFWLSRECLLRYLRATKWDVAEAIKRLTKSLVWRREFGISYDGRYANEVTADVVAVENETGKQLILGFDRARRPLLYLKNGKQNTKTSFRQVQLLVYMLESTVALMPQGVENAAILVDFKHYKEPGVITASMPPIAIGKQVLNILQDHYPERMGKGLLANIPWLGWTFLKLIHPLIDPNTREKIVFDEPFEKFVEPSQLEAIYNGRLDFQYKHDVYWPDLAQKVVEQRQTQHERFLKFGGTVGLSEYDFKGTHDDPLYPVEYAYGHE